MKALWIKYRLALIISIAAVWMLFIDSNNFVDLIKVRKEIRELKQKKSYYESEIIANKKQRNDLFTNERSLEKFAREKYLMKKDNEDLFIFTDEKSNTK